MNMWLRKVGSGAIALTLAAGLAGCNNGNGGGLLTLFFGMNNNGACDSVIVDLNLIEAGGVLARDEFQNPLCSLDQDLQADGCTANFEEINPLDNGPAANQGITTDNLRANISCPSGIPAVSSLFQCQFTDVDLEVLQATVVAQCSCTTPGCDTTPPVCVSQKDTPGACEDCNDGKDNDKNGFTDCDDANCQYDPACQATTTTSTSSTSVTIASTTTLNSTTTSTSSTTSTTGVPPLACTIVFDLKDAVTLGSFSFDINYSAVPGQMIGSGGTTQCTTLAGGTTIVVNDVDATKTATAGGFAIAGVTGPLNLVSCDFLANTTPVKADFTLTGTEATDVNGDPTAIPAFGVASINCTGPTTTTTLAPTTTTTIPDATTTTTVSGPAQYKIRFKLNSACGKSVVSLGLTSTTPLRTAPSTVPVPR